MVFGENVKLYGCLSVRKEKHICRTCTVVQDPHAQIQPHADIKQKCLPIDNTHIRQYRHNKELYNTSLVTRSHRPSTVLLYTRPSHSDLSVMSCVHVLSRYVHSATSPPLYAMPPNLSKEDTTYLINMLKRDDGSNHALDDFEWQQTGIADTGVLEPPRPPEQQAVIL